jgi:hypothetical protein
LSSAPRGQRESTGRIGANQIFLLGSAERVRKQIDGLSGIFQGDCGLIDRQRQRGQNDVATDFLRGTEDNTMFLSKNTSRKCRFMF